jgi:molecular chaperone IbpA
MSLKQRGHAMRTFDFAPFYRSTVGFDRLFSMLDQVGGVESAAAPGYPPYNIKRSGENAYNISVAVAGFAGADLSIEVKENTLTIRGNKQSSGEAESDLIYQGIAERNFERNFQLADHVQIEGASLENGLLQVDLLRVVPEAMKPRAIPITTAKKVVLEGKAAKIAA